jgi:hypothetical protein
MTGGREVDFHGYRHVVWRFERRAKEEGP